VKGHADVAAVDVRGHGQDLVMPHPKPVSPLFASIFYSVFAALGVAFVALALRGGRWGFTGRLCFC
jgi:pimeloyl-ACP methyl ester carboxylesterase